MKPRNLLFCVLGIVIVGFAAFCLGYRHGYENGGVEMGQFAIEQIRVIRAAIEDARVAPVDTSESIATEKTTISGGQSYCLVLHPDGRQCLSDGSGGYISHD